MQHSFSGKHCLDDADNFADLYVHQILIIRKAPFNIKSSKILPAAYTVINTD